MRRSPTGPSSSSSALQLCQLARLDEVRWARRRYKHLGVGVSMDADRTNLWRPVGHMGTTRRDPPQRLIRSPAPMCRGSGNRKRDVACRACVWGVSVGVPAGSRPQAACHRPRRHPGGEPRPAAGKAPSGERRRPGADVDGVGGLQIARRQLHDQRSQRGRLGDRLARVPQRTTVPSSRVSEMSSGAARLRTLRRPGRRPVAR